MKYGSRFTLSFPCLLGGGMSVWAGTPAGLAALPASLPPEMRLIWMSTSKMPVIRPQSQAPASDAMRFSLCTAFLFASREATAVRRESGCPVPSLPHLRKTKAGQLRLHLLSPAQPFHRICLLTSDG